MPQPPALLRERLAFSLPKPGARLDLPAAAGSSDALVLTELAKGCCAGRLLVVIAASPLEAQRLLEEIAWFAPDLRAHLLPDWETLPYDGFSPHQDLISERLSTLYAITRGQTDIAIVPASTALYRLAPPEYLAAYTFFLKKGERLDVEGLKAQLALAGYHHVTQVVSPGEFSVRGGLIDLYPMGSAVPYRIDLFDDEVESIRTFDVDTQRTIYPVPEIRLLPAREFPTDDKGGRTRFRSRYREVFEGDPSRSPIYKDVSAGILPPGIEYYLPLFHEHTAVIFDYLPTSAVVCLHGRVSDAIQEFWRDTRSRYDLMGGDRTRPLLPPGDLFLSEEAFFGRLGALPRISLGIATDSDGTALAQPLPSIAVERKAEDPLARLRVFLADSPIRTLVLAESAGRRETIQEYLAEYRLRPAPCADFRGFAEGGPAFALGVGPLSTGFILPEAGLAIVTENELYAATARPRHKRAEGRKASVEGWLRDLSELKVGDPVVHESHGVGRYLGLVHLDLGEGETEFLHLEYAGGDKLYVPVAQLQVISRFSGVSPESVQLHRLGSGQWEKARKKAAEQVRKPSPTASASKKPRTSYPPSTPWWRTCSRASPWTGWYAAMWALARPKWRSAPPSWRWPMASRSPCSPPPPCSPNSTIRTSATALPNGRYAWPRSPASSQPKNKPRHSKTWQKAK